MKKNLLLLLFIFLCSAGGSQALEINSPKPVETYNHVVPQNTKTINSDLYEPEDYYSPEVELKGSVIYNEGVNAMPEVELENVEKPKINLKTANMIIPVNEKPKKANTTIPMPSRSVFAGATRLKGEDYCLIPVWSQVKESMGNFSYGTEYFTYVDTAQLESNMNIYTRYDFKHFAITGSVGTNEKQIQGMNDNIIRVAPEIKISKSFIIRDTIQAYVNTNVKKNKISIIYTPTIKNNPDVLRFELGFSNSFYEDGRTNSAVEFSTKIRL